MFDRGFGVAVNSMMALGLSRACISRDRPVTALCASSHDQQRPVEVQQVGKGELDPAACRFFQALRGIPDTGKMRLEILVVSVDLAAVGVFDAQGLNGADHDAAVVTQVVWPDMRKVGDIEHPYPAIERFIQRLPVRMTGMLQRFGSLLANLVGRHQPHDQGIVLLHPSIACNRDGIGGEQGFATAGGQPQADVGDVRQFGQRCILPGITPDPRGLLRLCGNRLVSGRRPGETGLLEEAAQRV